MYRPREILSSDLSALFSGCRAAPTPQGPAGRRPAVHTDKYGDNRIPENRLRIRFQGPGAVPAPLIIVRENPVGWQYLEAATDALPWARTSIAPPAGGLIGFRYVTQAAI